MSTKITLTYCGMEGEGANVTKAKQDAARRIERVLSGDWAPYVLVHEGWRAFVFREPGPTDCQWDYKTIAPTDESRYLYGARNYASRGDAIAAAAYHLAQCVGHYRGLEKYLDGRTRLDLDGYFAWQAAYAEAKARGMDDEACREYANRRA